MAAQLQINRKPTQTRQQLVFSHVIHIPLYNLQYLCPLDQLAVSLVTTVEMSLSSTSLLQASTFQWENQACRSSADAADREIVTKYVLISWQLMRKGDNLQPSLTHTENLQLGLLLRWRKSHEKRWKDILSPVFSVSIWASDPHLFFLLKPYFHWSN